MLACARIGAIHSVVFGGFSAESLRDRINDSQCRLLITADGGYRRGQIVALKQMADEALAGTPSIEHVIVVQRVGAAAPIAVTEGATTGITT
jgi:acetyl-CoA synthetase